MLESESRATSNPTCQLLPAKTKDLGGFSVRRLFPTIGRKMVGPWVFFDHVGPTVFPAGNGINVRPHPHIGIATVTYLFEGEILHRDSLGNLQTITPGAINLMVAGSGITHSERERPEVTATDHPLHGLQLWLALPEESEETDPAFFHISAASIPAVDVEGVPVRVLMGSAYGVTSPVPCFSPTLYIEADLKPGQALTLPDAEELGIYTATGEIKVGITTVPENTMAVVETAKSVRIVATEATRLAMIGGNRLSPRFVDWNFVSSSKSRIEQAKQDWRQGRFAKVVGDEIEFIPLPD